VGLLSGRGAYVSQVDVDAMIEQLKSQLADPGIDMQGLSIEGYHVQWLGAAHLARLACADGREVGKRDGRAAAVGF